MILNMIYGGGGSDVASGTVTATKVSSSPTSAIHSVEVTGLDFQPQNVMLVTSGVPSSSFIAVAVYNENLLYRGSNGYVLLSLTATFADNGFNLSIERNTGASGALSGTYYWVAWKEKEV